MIQPNELRKGNLIYRTISLDQDVIIPNTVDTVVGFNAGDVYFDHGPHLEEMSIPIKHCAGIPLTPEWLERAGFKAVDKPMYVNGKQYLLQVSNDYVDNEEGEIINRDGTWFDGIGTFNFKTDGSMAVNVLCRGNYVCRSASKVHELQNLYFVLTGKELEFKEI